ncbi:HNH endonuclease [Bradyrhizobium sp. CCBAU 53415]|uniref:HNH endonuclease n=1 Tax=Bradyrhizobium sp. CCBAU 53415 TaxID=1325119 RepID=UPI0023055718|nr:hypothetical protein [Bradyrhizobium sp. CCBAU 53415]
MKHYNRPEWRAFRSEVIRLHDGVCNRCQRGPDDGVTLQVHHKIYLPKRLPWQYPYEACEALCKGCHAEEHGKIMPQTGWEHFDDFVDLGGLDGECELCGTAIRYVFPVHHSNWGTMEVGEHCCDHLTSSNYAVTQIRHVKRRTRFVFSCRWVEGKSGTASILQNGVALSIVPDGSNYKLCMNGKTGKKQFGSVLEAKMTAFDLIDSGVAQAYLLRAKARSMKVARTEIRSSVFGH